MENYAISVRYGENIHDFEIGEYLHHNERCKYRIYENGAYVASFEPDAQNYLHICQNVSGLDEDLLYRLAEQIEVLIPHFRGTEFDDNALENKDLL